MQDRPKPGNVCAHSFASEILLTSADKLSQAINLYLTLMFPHISSCKIKHLMGQDVEEGARMGHASR